MLDENVVVDRIPYNLAPTVECFLRQEVSKSFAEVTSSKVYQGAAIVWKFLAFIGSMDQKHTARN